MNKKLNLLGLIFFVIFGLLGAVNIVSAKTTTVATCTSATFNGTVSSTRNNLTYAWFQWGTTDRSNDDYFNMTTSQVFTSRGDFSETVFGLTPNTTYYYKAMASNRNGTRAGKTISFKTPLCGAGENLSSSSAPTATTLAATKISNTNAELNSLIVNRENLSSKAWFEWGTTINLGNKTRAEGVGSSPSVSHEEMIKDLTPGTIYYYRAVAENSEWRNIGSILNFTTSGGASIAKSSIEANKKTINPTPIKNTPEDNDTSSLPASVLGADSFFPTTLFGWLFLLLLIFIFALLTRYAYAEFEGKKNEIDKSV